MSTNGYNTDGHSSYLQYAAKPGSGKRAGGNIEDPAELEEILVMGGWEEVGKDGAEAEVVVEEVELDPGKGVADSVWELRNVDDWYQR